MIRRHRARTAIAVLFVGTLLAVLGCETDDRLESLTFAERSAAGDESVDEAGLFHPEVSLYRRYTGSRWMVDKDHIFTVKDESHVRAVVEFANMRPERTYSLHLVWIKPDGREMFRRYAEVRRHEVRLPDGVAPDSTGALPGFFRDRLVSRFGEEKAASIGKRLAADPGAVVPVNERIYKKAVDLGYARRKLYVGADPTFQIDSRLNISREKQRDPGDYLLRIYLDRRLLVETPFTVQEKS